MHWEWIIPIKILSIRNIYLYINGGWLQIKISLYFAVIHAYLDTVEITGIPDDGQAEQTFQYGFHLVQISPIGFTLFQDKQKS